MEVETMLRGKYDGKKMRKEFKTLHDDTDLCKNAPVTNYRWELIQCKHKLKAFPLMICFRVWLEGPGFMFPSTVNFWFSKGWVKIPFPFWPCATVYPQALAYATGAALTGAPHVSPQKAICWFTLNSAQGLSVITTLCSSTPARIICNGKSNTKEWSGKDCVSWKQEPAVKVSV